ncbi:4Fe-4S binding protein [Chloroflexota bacterium]
MENAGIAEAKRCFGCGKCNACNMCWFLCPDSSVLRSAEQMQFDYDYCKGCGVCAEECPRRAVIMEEESKWQ